MPGTFIVYVMNTSASIVRSGRTCSPWTTSGARSIVPDGPLMVTSWNRADPVTCGRRVRAAAVHTHATPPESCPIAPLNGQAHVHVQLRREGGRPGMHWKGGGYPPPLPRV